MASATDATWADRFRAAIAPVRHLKPFDHAGSTALLQQVAASGLLSLTDVRDSPERFFEAHRILAEEAAEGAQGFWIRFTVHYNLCCGTVVALGEERHLRELSAMAARGDVGCFALTERRAGVNSGLVVETVAEYDPSDGGFWIHTPDEGACKNWISSGLQANKAVVVADLRMPGGGGSRGAHAFLVSLRPRVGGALSPGVEMGDMGVKTIANDLDNAWIRFTRLKVPGSALLSRYGGVDATGKYVQKVDGVKNFQMIGQRLFTGRVCVAQAAGSFARAMLERARRYADGKECWAPGGGAARPLSALPQLKSLFAEALEDNATLERFMARVEAELCAVLRKDGIPSPSLQLAVAVGKVACVERSIAALARLKQDVGSYALMADSGFQNADFLQACKFAEGDSRILMQKMARDRVATFEAPPGCSPEETALADSLRAAVAAAGGGRAGKAEAWDARWRDVYALAERVQARVIEQWAPRESAAAASSAGGGGGGAAAAAGVPAHAKSRL